MEINADPRYLDYFRLFREEKFFEAHEVLEGLWLETKGGKRKFYQGLIQLAAVLVHFQRGNEAGAKALFQSAKGYLQSYPRHYEGVPISLILKDFEAFLASWARHPKEPLVAKRLVPRVILHHKNASQKKADPKKI